MSHVKSIDYPRDLRHMNQTLQNKKIILKNIQKKNINLLRKNM